MKSIVSLEVGSDAIRAAEINGPLSKNPRMVNIGEIALEPGVAGDSLIINRDAFMEKLKELWEQEKFKTKNVCLVVSGRRFIVRDHETNHNDLKVLKDMLPMETKSVVPESMLNPIIDFYPTHAAEVKGEIKTSGLIVATPSDPIEMMVNAIAEAGYAVEYIDFAPMSIARFIRNQTGPTSSYVLANIREESTDILVAKNGIPRLVRVTSNGLEPIKKQIGRHAVDISSIQSFNKGAFSQDSPMTKLAREINMTSMTAADSMGATPETLYLTGPRSSDSELIRTLEDVLKIDVIALHTIVEVPKDKEFDEEMSASDFVAITGGMRGKK